MSKECVHKRQVLALRQINGFDVDEDDEFYNEVQEVDAFANIGIHYCLDCQDTVDIWIEEPYQAEVFQLREKVERLQVAAAGLVAYRDAVGPLNFQLEKADDFINALRTALAQK